MTNMTKMELVSEKNFELLIKTLYQLFEKLSILVLLNFIEFLFNTSMDSYCFNL